MRTAQLHLQRSTETKGLRHSCLRQSPRSSAKARHSSKYDTVKGITCDDHLSANRPQPGMWHSRPGCDFAPTGASKSAPQAGPPVDLSLDTHPAYELIDMATRQLHGVFHGVLHGIQSDGTVTEEEVYGLRDWLEHFHIFRGAWPFSEAFALVDHILEDNHVSAEELTQFHAFCNHFSERPTNLRPVEEKSEAWAANAAPYLQPVGGICQHDIPVIFEGKCFCFTGGNKQFKRATLRQHVTERGGRFTDTMVKDLDYLVLCEIGSRLWVYASYGRKVEAAMEKGIPVITVERFLGVADSSA